MTIIETYRAAKKRTGDTAEACAAVIAAHGVTTEQAAELCWQIETGKPAPAWAVGPQSEATATCAEVKAWDRGFERRAHGGR